MKKSSILFSIFFGCILFLGAIVGVNATTLDNDTNNYLQFPTSFNSSSKLIVSNSLPNYTTYYQTIAVEDNSNLAKAIDNYFTAQMKLNKISDTNSTEYLEAQSQMNTYYSEVKSNIPDYVVSDWATTVNDVIYDNTVVTNTTDGRYVVWTKVISGTTTLYDFSVYSFKTYGSSVANPDTGISNSYLYVGVVVLVVAGTYLVMSKNKERYE